MPKKVKVKSVAVPVAAEGPSGNHLQVQFFDPRTQQYYVIGNPLTRVDEKRAVTGARGGRELWGTHSRGRDLLATLAPGDTGWRIQVEPIRGSFDFLVVPFEAKTSIDEVQA